jgi:hypothetical protein
MSGSILNRSAREGHLLLTREEAMNTAFRATGMLAETNR